MSAISSNIHNFSFHKKLEKAKTHTKNVWEELLPVISTIALGAIFSPVFRFGAAVGTIDVIIQGSSLAIISLFSAAIGIREPTKDPKKNYINDLNKHHAFVLAVVGPVAEELLFRGLILNAVKEISKFVVTERLILLPLGIAMPLTSTIAIVVSAIGFGVAHLSNTNNSSATTQAALSAYSGLIYGIMSESFGILAPIGAHIVNNSIVTCLLKLVGPLEEEPKKIKLGQLKPTG